MNKFFINFVIFVFLVFSVFSYSKAQEISSGGVGIVSISDETTGEELVDIDESIVINEIKKELAKEGKEIKILPDNFLYSFKNFGGEVRALFTSDTQKDAELRFRYANEKIIEADILANKGEMKILARHLKKYERDLEKINRLNGILAKKNAEEAKKIAEKTLASQLRHQVLLGKFEKKSAIDDLVKIKEIREKTLDEIAKTIKQNTQYNESGQVVGYTETLSNLGTVLTESGSPFKSLRNLEVLKAVEEKVPEEAKDAIRLAQENSIKRFKNQIEALPEKYQGLVSDYAAQMGGDEALYIKTFDAMKNIEYDVYGKIASAREAVFERLNKRVKKAEEKDPKFVENIFIHLEGASADNLRAIKEIERNIDKDLAPKMTEIKEKIMTRYDDKGRLDSYREEIKEKSDVIQIKITEELTDAVSEKNKEAVIKIKEDIVKSIVDKAKETKDEEQKEVVERAADDSPESIEIINKEFAGTPEVKELLLKKQSQNIEGKIKYIEDAARLKEIKEELSSEKVKPTIETYAPKVFEKLKTKEEEIEKKTPEPTKEPAKEPGIELPKIEPVLCLQVYSPVCGVDNKTYSNRCAAEKQNNVKVAYEGKCKEPAAETCSKDYNPVCGGDNKTYTNSCFAEQAKVKVQYKGECKKTEPTPEPTPTPTPEPTPVTYPDLYPKGIAVSPQNPQEGDIMTFSVTIANGGDADAKEFVVQLGIDIGNKGSSDVNYAETMLSLGSMKSGTTNFNKVWPSKLGAHKVEACVDSKNQITESNEKNNCFSVTFTVSKKVYPDLTTQSLSFFPNFPVVGDSMTFTAVFNNQGEGDAGSFTGHLNIDGRLISKSSAITSLAVNKSQTVSFDKVWAATLGKHTYEICADAASEIEESNETNNCVSSSFTVSETQEQIRADYAIQSTAISPSAPRSGDLVSFSAIVLNQGTAMGATSSYARLRVDESNDGKWDVTKSDVVTDAIIKNGTEKEVFNDAWKAIKGDHKYEICVDITNLINESNENNNCHSEIFTVSY